MRKCTLVLNTRWGYELAPVECRSIKEAITKAKESEMAYRIFIDGRLIKRGWYVRKEN